MFSCGFCRFSRKVCKVEELYYKDTGGEEWELFGEGKKQITGIPINEIGVHLEGGINLEKTKKMVI